MGCTPSHTDITHSLTKSGIQLFKKPTAILPGPCEDSARDSIPSPGQNSICYDSGGRLSRRHSRMDECLESKATQTAAKGFAQLLRDPTAAQRKDLGTLIPDSKTSPSRLNKSQSLGAKDNLFRTQTSRQAAAPGQDLGESKGQETSLWNREGPDHCSGTQAQGCQTVLPAPGPQGQVDFPEPLVTAHRHAYTYLHYSLSRYEAVLDLAHQASHTQELLQPMVHFLLCCFEEVNRLLGEISGAGDVLLRDIEWALGWAGEKGEPGERPPLLQQLLQHTVSKLQALQSAAASLTSSVLQSSCGRLHSTAGQVREKLSTKRGVEEHLCRTLGQLEDLASGRRDPRGQGLPLCSEDSGIGADAEPVPAGDTPGQQASCNSEPEVAAQESVNPPQVGPSVSRPTQLPCPFQDCPFSRSWGSKVQPTSEWTAGDPEASSSVPEMGPPHLLGLSPGTGWDSPGLVTFAPEPLPKGPRGRDTPSLSEGGDSSSEEKGVGVSGSCPGAWQENVSPPRPRSSPMSSESMWQKQFRRLRGPQAQEMTLKMQEAISERIKFIPVPSGQPDWVEEEEGGGTMAEPPQLSTGSGGRGIPTQHRRPQSEPCVGSHAGDPTLQQLPSVQRDLSLRLDMFHALGTQLQGPSQEQGSQQPRAVAQRPAGHMATATSALSRLRASLNKSCSILPSQDRSVRLQRSPQPERHRPWWARDGGFPPGTSPGTNAREMPGAKDETVGGRPARTSVKKLIETFSLPESRSVLKDSGPRPSLRNWGVPTLPPRFPIYRGLAPLYPKPQISPAGRESPQRSCTLVFPPLLAASPPPSRTLSTETDESPELLPPPALEVLMDTSFTSLEAPESGEPAGCSPEGTPVAGRGGASPKLRASPSPSTLPASRGAASPSRPRGAVLGSRKSSCRPQKLPEGLHLLPAASRNPETEQSRAQHQVRVNRATAVWKPPGKALPWNPSSHTLVHTKASGPSLGRPAPGPHSPEAPTHGQERSPPRARKASCTRRTRTSPEVNRPPWLGSSRAAQTCGLPSPAPPLCPLASPRVLSPPRVEKRVSPPPQHGPPAGSPPAQPPGSSSPCPEASPPSSSPGTESSPASSGLSLTPPVSPAQGHKEVSSSAEGTAALKNAPGNTCSIFCPATTSLFEAKPPFPTAPPTPPLGSPPGSWRSNPGAPQRGVSQPFIRRAASDCRPGSRPLPPVSGASRLACESQLGSTREDGPGASGLKGSGRAASAPDLCVLGHGLHLEASSSRAQAQPEAQPRQKEGACQVGQWSR